MFLTVFQKIKAGITDKVEKSKSGLYVYLLFPISMSFLLTFTGSRIISHLAPWLYLPVVPGLRVHHFAYGFFVLAASGYFALIYNGAKAKYFISLLHGFGLGLAFDEFAMWLRLRDDDAARWSYDGFLVFLSVVILILTAKPGIKMLKKLVNFNP